MKKSIQEPNVLKLEALPQKFWSTKNPLIICGFFVEQNYTWCGI